MTTFLFWNLGRRPLERALADLAYEHAADVVILAESVTSSRTLLAELNRQVTGSYFETPVLGCTRLRVFVRFDPYHLTTIYEEDRLSIRSLHLPPANPILIAMLHLPSKRNWSTESQGAESQEVNRAIRTAEREVGHERTLVVGDLNMNPFEPGMVNANGFNGVMSRTIASKRYRRVLRPYPYFYNPMWSLFGDASGGPPGTYYYANSEHHCLYWNMFDQVLVRPDLLDRFDNAHLSIPVTVGGKSLLTAAGIPNKQQASDHLPLVFRLSLSMEGRQHD